MVDVGTQTVSNTEVNPRDLSTLKNDTFLATFINKTQGECVDLHSNNRDIIDFDSAIVSVGRSNDNQRLQSNSIGCHAPDDTSENQYRTHFDDQLQINVVDQMITHSHIPYVLLPKHFQPKQISNDQNQRQPRLSNSIYNNNGRAQRQKYSKDDDHWHKPVMHRYFIPNKFYSSQNRSHTSVYIAPSYDNNKGRGSYALSEQQRGGFQYTRNGNDCIRDDHRINISTPQSRIDTGANNNTNNMNNFQKQRMRKNMNY